MSASSRLYMQRTLPSVSRRRVKLAFLQDGALEARLRLVCLKPPLCG
jgi:hypothetical protein